MTPIKKYGVLPVALAHVALSCLDSDLPSTREWWRFRIGFSEEIINDPRPLAEIFEEQLAGAAND